ncbi:MAG: hypothetical protein WCP66_08305 [Methylococcales bacterium]
MTTITFDTLHFANRLKSVGFTDEQAQVLIELQLSVINTTLEQLKQHRQLNDLSTTQTNRD